ASWSRGGWVGFGAAVLVMVFLTPMTWRRGFLLIAVLVILSWLLYSTGLFPQNITDRLTGFSALFQFSDIRSVGITDANFSLIERIAHWQTALDMWRSRFWFGIGLGGYESAYPLFRMPNWTLPLGHAHNIYLNMLAETGILGLSAYGLFMGTILVKLGRAAHSLDGWLRGLAVGLTGAWIHLMVHNLVDNLLVNNVHLHVGLMLALSAWVITKAGHGDLPEAIP
ncbi:MAG: O-antigen ligase domain-containing protein, partial [Anaerolineales bacterium]